MLTNEDPGVHVLYRPEEITPSAVTADQRAVAEQVLAAVPGGPERLLYARVDLVRGADGNAVLLELELTEPSLYLGYAAGAADGSPRRSCAGRGDCSAGDDRQPPRGCDEQAREQLDQDRQADGLERMQGRRPGLTVRAEPDPFG
jgi:hypothetical protein